MIADLYNIPIGTIEKLIPNFLMKKSMCFIMRPYNFTWNYNQLQNI